MSKLAANAGRLLTVLPFAQAFTGQTQSPKLMAAAGLVNTPFVRRAMPGLSAAVTVGIAAVAVVSFVKNMKAKKVSVKEGELYRSSAT